MDDKSLIDDEIAAIRSIYEEEDIFSYDAETRRGRFFAKYESPSQFLVNIVSEKCQLTLKHLPAVLLRFELPEDYPSKSAPKFQLHCRWLSSADLERVCKRLDSLWQQSANSSILFTWISFLNDELFEFLDLRCEKPIDIKEESPCLSSESSFARRGFKQSCSSDLLKKYNEDEEEAKYLNAYHACGVCFLEKLGSQSFKFFKCGHVYCNECMKAYFETQIADGNVKSLTCPYDQCDTQAQPAQVLALLGLEQFNRYDTLLLKDSLNSMADIVYCPRAKCQCAVIPTDETLAHCTACEYVFCALCRQGYHGIEPCKITNTQLKQICQAYESGNAETRAKLEKQYGEKRIQRALEETASMETITATSKQCPNCKSWLQKLDGCNKMTCIKCHCYFCWLCLEKLSKIDPYSHFNTRSSECFEKLFEGVINQNGDGDNGLLVIDDDDEEDESEHDYDDDEEEEEDNDEEEDDDDINHNDENLALRLQMEEFN